MDVEAITSQKIAVGLVENPACWRLRELAAAVPAGQAIVELGAYQGRTTGWLALGAQEGHGARVYSVDPWEHGVMPRGYVHLARPHANYRLSETREAYERHLERTGVRPFVETIQATAVVAARSYSGPPVGLLWHDALHRRQDVRDDLRAWLKHLAPDATVALHDAGDPRFGVEDGARDALAEGWDWPGELMRWPKQPARRGMLIVTRGGVRDAA